MQYVCLILCLKKKYIEVYYVFTYIPLCYQCDVILCYVILSRYVVGVLEVKSLNRPPPQPIKSLQQMFFRGLDLGISVLRLGWETAGRPPVKHFLGDGMAPSSELFFCKDQFFSYSFKLTQSDLTQTFAPQTVWALSI